MEQYYEYDSDAYTAGTCNLDKANGNVSTETFVEFNNNDFFVSGATHPTTGEYSYFMTTTYPWVPIYYYGDEGASDLCSAA